MSKSLLTAFALGTAGVFIAIMGMFFIVEIATLERIIPEMPLYKSMLAVLAILVFSAFLGGSAGIWMQGKIEDRRGEKY